MAEHFAGFPRGGLEFLAGLAADNSRSFFDTHRRSYERDMRAPVRLFVTDVAALLRSTVAPAIQAEPTVGKSLFRINRDTRFSKDKTPYHPWMGLPISRDDWQRAGARSAGVLCGFCGGCVA